MIFQSSVQEDFLSRRSLCLLLFLFLSEPITSPHFFFALRPESAPDNRSLFSDTHIHLGAAKKKSRSWKNMFPPPRERFSTVFGSLAVLEHVQQWAPALAKASARKSIIHHLPVCWHYLPVYFLPFTPFPACTPNALQICYRASIVFFSCTVFGFLHLFAFPGPKG